VDRITSAFLLRVEKEKADRSEDAMRYPREGAFEHGVQVGTWQGLDLAVQLMKVVLEEDDQRERSSK